MGRDGWRSTSAATVAALAIALLVVSVPAPTGGRGPAATAAAAAVDAAIGGPGAPTALTVDGDATPVGVDDRPAFAWLVSDPRRGARQVAYRVVVQRAGHDVWDSGRVPSAEQAFVPYRGPALAPDTRYSWTVQTWSADGRRSPLAPWETFDTGLSDRDWVAQWIRRATTDPVDAADEYTYARHEVPIGASPITRAVAHVSADQRFELFVNGAELGSGEAFSYPDAQYYQSIDVASAFRPGATNAIGVLAHWEGVGKGRPAGASGLIVQLTVDHADGTRDSVVSDGSWKVRRAPWLPGTARNQEGDPVDQTEHVDGTREPVGWSAPGFDDRTWSSATALGRHPVAPWTHLVGERTRIVEQPVHPRSVTTLSTGSVVADFGRVIAAVPVVSFDAGVPGRVVAMHGGYLLDGPGQGSVPGAVSTSRGTQHTDMSYAYVERLGRQTFHAFDYLGFRYLQIDGAGEPLAAGQITALARHDAVPDEDAATLSTSDPTVDAVFDLARHSALFGSQEQFIDTPTREKGPFLRDGFNISQVAMRAFGDQNLTRRALSEFAASQARYWPDGRLNAIYPSGQGKRDIPDFTLIYPEWVWDYALATGDRELVASVYPTVTAIADYVARATDPTTGLVTNLPGGSGDYQYGIVDWPKNMRYGYDMATVARTTVNMLAVDVFTRVATIGSWLGRPAAEQARSRARADALSRAINARLRRGDGRYVDGLEANGAPSAHASQHANAYAIAYGIASDGVDAPATAVADAGMAMGPQTAQLLLDALHRAGRDDALVKVVTDRGHDGWANVLAQGGTWTWETWRPDDANGDSMSHGWGSTVLVSLQQALLGVTPTAPGWATFDVRPPTGGLTHADGRVPTPRGPVVVSWSRPATATGSFAMTVTVPANGRATVDIPATSPSAITEDGVALSRAPGVTFVRMAGDLVVLSVGAGTYHFRSGAVPAGYVGAAVAKAATPVSPAVDDSPSPPLAGAGAGGAGGVVGRGPGAASSGSVRAPTSGPGSRWWAIVVAVLLLVGAAVSTDAVRRRATPGTRR